MTVSSVTWAEEHRTMKFLRERLGLFAKWAVGGLVVGASAGVLGYSLFSAPGSSSRQEEVVQFGVIGAIAGFFVFLAISVFRELWYESSKEVQLRRKAEARDPSLVHGFYVDIEKGEESAAWSAIAMLANYQDPEITEHVIGSVTKRLSNNKVLTTDRYAILRHMIKAIQNTRSVPNMRKLELLLKSENPDISAMAIRLGVGEIGKASVRIMKD